MRRQYAALPFRRIGSHLEVLLITSRETGRWIVPKGWPKPRTRPEKMAAREAFEEAGLVGRIDARPLGHYRYDKRLKSGRIVLCEVAVYPLEVTAELDDWPEKHQRQKRWLLPVDAVRLVAEPGLAALMLAIPLAF